MGLPVAQASSGFRFVHIFPMIFISLLIISIIANGVVQSIQQKNLTPLIQDIGNKFLLTSKNLELRSLDVINYNPTGDNNSQNVLKNILVFIEFTSAIYLVFLWINLMAWLASFLPNSFEGNRFMNYTIALFFFWFFQIIILLINAAVIEKNLQCVMGCDNSASNLLLTPFICFYLMFKAFYFIFKPLGPITSKIDSIVNQTIT